MPSEHAHPDVPSTDEPATPLCLHCLTPVSPLAHLCPHCALSVGQFTNYMPLEQIPFFAECVGGVWRRIWFGAGRPVVYRLFCIMVLASSVPWLFLASPLAIWQLLRERPQPAV